MTNLPDIHLTVVRTWPADVQTHFAALRSAIRDASAGAGPLDESLKWGQPAWRPRVPRTGSTLRVNWSANRPDRLMVYVDCKTDLAAGMADIYPDLQNDGRRALALALNVPPPVEAIAHLAAMTFTYHRN